MRIEDCKVGMKVVGNAESVRYTFTNKNRDFVGEIIDIDIHDSAIKVKVLKCINDWVVGMEYWVNPECFDLAEEKEDKVEDKMIIELKNPVNKEEVKVGDMIITDKGESVLIIYDEDKVDFRGYILSENRVTDYVCSIKKLIGIIENEEDLGEITRIIPAGKLKLMEV